MGWRRTKSIEGMHVVTVAIERRSAIDEPWGVETPAKWGVSPGLVRAGHGMRFWQSSVPQPSVGINCETNPLPQKRNHEVAFEGAMR